MKLLLTSTAFTHPQILNEFKNLIEKPLSDIQIAFVQTASRSEEELKYVKESLDELIEVGVANNHIKIFDFSNRSNKKPLIEFDVLYVCGGNTFHLLNEINKNRYRSEICNFINRDKVYVGVSAGSIILTPRIDISSVEPADPNDVGIKDLNGLNIIDFEVSPHTPEIVSFESVKEYAKRNKRKVWAFSDKSALSVNDHGTRIIGEKTEKLFDFTNN